MIADHYYLFNLDHHMSCDGPPAQPHCKRLNLTSLSQTRRASTWTCGNTAHFCCPSSSEAPCHSTGVGLGAAFIVACACIKGLLYSPLPTDIQAGGAFSSVLTLRPTGVEVISTDGPGGPVKQNSPLAHRRCRTARSSRYQTRGSAIGRVSKKT